MFFLKSSQKLNRKLNSLLVRLFARTSYRAKVDHKGFQISSDDPNGRFFSGLFVRLRWFNLRNTLSFRLQFAHDLEDTVMLVISLPWLVWFSFSVDIGWLDCFERWLGQFGHAQFGYEVDRTRIKLMWNYSAESDAKRPGWMWDYEWKQIHGTPVNATSAGATTEILYTQPRQHGYSESHHAMLLIPITTVQSWPRFWRRDKVTKGIQIHVEDPPMFPVEHSLYDDGLYSLFVPDVQDWENAIKIYCLEVYTKRRQA